MYGAFGRANRLRAILILAIVILAILFTPCTTAVHAQNTSHTATSSAQTSAASSLDRQLQQALALAERGDRQAAMDMVMRMIAEHPTFAPAIKAKGMFLEDAGQTAEAEAAFEEALKLAPQDPDLLREVGIDKLRLGQKEEALKLLERCVKLVPNDGDAQFYLAQLYHLNGKDELALRAIQQAVKAEPENFAGWQKYGELLCGTGHCEAALPLLLQAQSGDSSLPLIDFDIALTDYKLKDMAGTAQYAARAVELQPDNVSAWQMLADADAKLAKWADAKRAFERLLVLKPDEVESLLGLGQSELELKNYPAAIDKLQLVLRLAPTRILAHFYLSRAFAGMGRTADAEHESALHHLMMEQLTFGRSVQVEEREAPIKDRAYALLLEHREQEALQLYRERFKGTTATTADAYVFLGKLYLLAGNKEDGLRALQHALEIQPTVRGARTYRGILALQQGDLRAAENEFKAELANDPNYQLAIAETGELRYRQGNWAEAAEQLAKSRTMNPELLYMLSDAYFRIGKVSDADLTAETVAAYGRNNADLLKQLSALLLRNGQSELAQHLSTGSDLPASQGVPHGISLTTKVRVHDTPGWWPTKGDAARERFVGNAACEKCHAAKAASYNNAAMSHAAISAEDSEIIRKRDSLHFRSGPYRYEAQDAGGKALLKVSDAASSASVPLLWGFGVGHMGQTYLYEQGGNYYESHVTFFTRLQALDITPGQSPSAPENLESAAGRRMGAEEAQACYSCHTTASTAKGKFDPIALMAGVGCESCHGPGLNHVTAANSGNADTGESLIFNPAKLDRVAAVDFCGSCHRTSKDVLASGNVGIFSVRFAPYRLEKSACWKQGDNRIACTACHDPHKPLEHESGSYDAACMQCHTTASTEKTVHTPPVCSVGTKNCVTCHMQKYEPPGMHSSFTDHWIRVARSGEPYPE
jgi:tetratricopeptide (TPR) repeat protein